MSDDFETVRNEIDAAGTGFRRETHAALDRIEARLREAEDDRDRVVLNRKFEQAKANALEARVAELEARLREAEEHLKRHHTPEPRTDVARQQVMTRLHEAEARVAELEQEIERITGWAAEYFKENERLRARIVAHHDISDPLTVADWGRCHICAALSASYDGTS